MDVTINQNASQIIGTLPSNHDAGCVVRLHPASGTGGIWCLEFDTHLVGRDPDCDIQLEDTSVSRNHAEIINTDDGYLVRDLGSTNGTWINDVKVSEQKLHASDRIRFGNQILKFLSSNDIEVQFHETIYKLTTTDGLTGAYNRHYLTDELTREISRSMRRDRPLSLMMLDIDHFKKVNDTYGHLAGDQVLQEFAKRIQQTIEDDDVLARYGGEEFALVLSEQDQQHAQDKAEQVRRAIAQSPFETEAATIDITASIGVATLTSGARTTPKQITELADQKLYMAKESGRNQVRSTVIE